MWEKSPISVSEATKGEVMGAVAAAAAAVSGPNPNPPHRHNRIIVKIIGTAIAAITNIFLIAMIPSKIGTSRALMRMNLNVAMRGKIIANLFASFFLCRPENHVNGAQINAATNRSILPTIVLTKCPTENTRIRAYPFYLLPKMGRMNEFSHVPIPAAIRANF